MGWLDGQMLGEEEYLFECFSLAVNTNSLFPPPIPRPFWRPLSLSLPPRIFLSLIQSRSALALCCCLKGAAHRQRATDDVEWEELRESDLGSPRI